MRSSRLALGQHDDVIRPACLQVVGPPLHQLAALGQVSGMVVRCAYFVAVRVGQLQFDVGMASAGGLIAVVIANIAAIILVRMIGKNLTDKP